MKAFAHSYFPVDHGGKFDFIGWAGLSKSDPWAFYTSDAVRTYTCLAMIFILTFTSLGNFTIQAIDSRSAHPRQ